MNSTDIDQWCHRRWLARARGESVGRDLTMDYPITLEVGRYDPETDEEWYVATFEVMAHIGPEPGGGWQLDEWSYIASRYDYEAPHPKLREQRIRASGFSPLDGAIEEQVRRHLRMPVVAGDIDIEWNRHVAWVDNLLFPPPEREEVA